MKNKIWPMCLMLLLFTLTNSCDKSGSAGFTAADETASIVIETLPGGSLIEMPSSMNSSDPTYLYLGSSSAVVQVDKTTGRKRTVVGNIEEGLPPDTREVIGPIGLQLAGDHIYGGSYNGLVFGAFTGTDAFDAVELFLPSLPGTTNFIWMGGNSTALFYNGDDGIYANDYGTLDGPKLILPITSGLNAIATDSALFIISYPPALIKYDLASKQISTIQSGLTLQTGSILPAPLAVHGTKLYWMNGKSLYGLDTTAGTPYLIATINTNDTLPQIVADDQNVYARPTNLYTIYKISLSTGDVTTIPLSEGCRGMTTEGGKLYFLYSSIGVKLNTLSDTGDVIQLYDSSGFSKLGEIRGIGLTSHNGKLLLMTGYRVLIYDIASQTNEIIPAGDIAHGYFYAQGGKLYMGSEPWHLVLSVPIDKKIRSIEQIYPATPIQSPYGFPVYNRVSSTVLDQGYVYWITVGFNVQSPIYYRISKAAVDGSNYQMLFESTGELRDIAIHNGKLYFSCNGQCGDPGWVLASMPETGGAPTPIVGLLGDPLIYYKDGIFYDADTNNFAERSLFAINVDVSDDEEILSRLYYDDQTPRNVFVDASSNWLYVAQTKINPGGPPSRKISRYKLNSWNSLGPEQTIIDGSRVDVNLLLVNTSTTDGKYLYYWHDGNIKRVAE